MNFHLLAVGETRSGVSGPTPRNAKLYCPIRLIQTHHSLLGALASIGLEHDRALALIDDAKLNKRRYIIANPGNDECYVVVSDSAGAVQIWQAMTDHAKLRRGEVEAFISVQREKQKDASKLAIFPLKATGRKALAPRSRP